MNLFRRIPLAVLALVLLLGGPAPAELIRLKSGKVLLGKIEGEPDQEGFLFRRSDNGGVLQIKWRHLMPADARRLKAKAGLLEDTEEEVLVKARKITVRIPGLARPKTYIGIVVGRKPGTIILRRKGFETEIRTEQIEGTPEWVDVPALEVYTPDEFYQKELQEIQPGDDPAKHEILARALKGAGDLERAKIHFQKVLELDPNYRNKAAVEHALQQIEAALNNRDLMEAMKKVRQAKGQKDFNRALALAAELDKKLDRMPGPLKQVWLAQKDKLIKDRTKYLASQVTERIYQLIRRLAQEEVIKRDVGPDEAKEFAEKEMPDLIVSKVAAQLGIDKEEVLALWNKRENFHLAKPRSATYGDGTFILPKEKAYAGTSLEGSLARGNSRRARQNEMQRRIKEFLRRQLQKRRNRAGGRGGQQAPQEVTPEDWWKNARVNERRLWLIAYFAEFSGMMKVKKAYAEPCPTCGGTGYISALDANSGKEIRVKCPACHGYRMRRRILFY